VTNVVLVFTTTYLEMKHVGVAQLDTIKMKKVYRIVSDVYQENIKLKKVKKNALNVPLVNIVPVV